ncbi:MAG: LysR family transcriptional regulator [Solirubrobacterales bacterium]|nr:LysR family transcriptional regulator [Solirubrobacterales bacterium]
MDIELRHLRYFTAVAEELHFGRAAERLHITQPSLSQQIRKLEGIIGVELFDRTSRAVGLTAAGEALRVHTGRAFEDVDEAVAAARDAAQGIIGNFSVGFVEPVAIGIVPAAVRRFRESHPRVRLKLRELSVPDQIDGLITGALDLGFVLTDPAHGELMVDHVLEERFVVAVPSGHRLAGRAELAPAEVVTEPLVVIEREGMPGLYDETVALVRRNGAEPVIAQRVTGILAVLGLVAAGIGLALLPASVRALRLSGIEYSGLDPSPISSVMAVRRRGATSPHIEPFLEAIRA